MHYIEGGWPGANPKDIEFFERMRDVKLNAKLVAFGSTRRAGADAAKDATLNVPGQRRHRLRDHRRQGARPARRARSSTTSLEENLAMLADSVRFLKSKGKARLLRRRALLRRLHRRRATTPSPACAPPSTPASTASCSATPTAARMTSKLLRDHRASCRRRSPTSPLGIHCHNDADVAVANSLAAVEYGVHAGAGLHQRLRRALRQRQHGQRHRRPQAQAGHRRRHRRPAGAPDRGRRTSSARSRT